MVYGIRTQNPVCEVCACALFADCWLREQLIAPLPKSPRVSIPENGSNKSDMNRVKKMLHSVNRNNG